MPKAKFRFYAELNEFLPQARRQRDFTSSIAPDASVKHAIEALGVPHTEVELILVDGEPVDFSHRLADGERVAVYPVFEALDLTPLLLLRDEPLRNTSFIADAHLGGLARLLRMAGFDTLYRNDFSDPEILRIALAEHRIVLTRDRELLKRRDLTHGCYVHALKPVAQLAEIVARLDLARSFRPLCRCLACNEVLTPIEKKAVAHRLPPNVRERLERFSTCAHCGSVLWEGSHHRRMRVLMNAVMHAAPSAEQR